MRIQQVYASVGPGMHSVNREITGISGMRLCNPEQWQQQKQPAPTRQPARRTNMRMSG
jgi:hypothetical protein